MEQFPEPMDLGDDILEEDDPLKVIIDQLTLTRQRLENESEKYIRQINMLEQKLRNTRWTFEESSQAEQRKIKSEIASLRNLLSWNQIALDEEIARFVRRLYEPEYYYRLDPLTVLLNKIQALNNTAEEKNNKWMEEISQVDDELLVFAKLSQDLNFAPNREVAIQTIDRLNHKKENLYRFINMNNLVTDQEIEKIQKQVDALMYPNSKWFSFSGSGSNSFSNDSNETSSCESGYVSVRDVRNREDSDVSEEVESEVEIQESDKEILRTLYNPRTKARYFPKYRNGECDPEGLPVVKFENRFRKVPGHHWVNMRGECCHWRECAPEDPRRSHYKRAPRR